MPSFKIDELKKELGVNDTVSIPYRSEKQERRGNAMGQSDRRPLDETKQLIKNTLKKEKRAMTFREIARSIDRRPTPRLRQILNDMILIGELVQEKDIAESGNMERFWYSLP